MTEAEFEQCINRICQGDKGGLKDIYTEYLPYLYRTVYSVVQNKEDAEDVTSDFFVKLWSIAPKYQPGNGHKGFLATIARNMAVDFLRKRRREVLVADPEQHLAVSHAGGASEDSEQNFDASVWQGAEAGGESSGAGNDLGQDSSGKKRGGTMAAAGPVQETPEQQVVESLSIQQILEKLKPEERQIIDMKVLGEMTFKEISELLGIPMGTVTWRYQEGIKKLRRYGYE